MEKDAKKIILENPKSFSKAFSFLVAKIAQIIGPKDANYEAYQELANYEMPPDFMTWYYSGDEVRKFEKFEMFRRTHKISATEVIDMNSKMHHDPLESRPRSASPKSKSKSKSKSGGRKRRTRTQRRSRVRRQKRRTSERR
jgi:hypothetical protein